MILIALTAAAAVAIFFPQTAIGRWLRRVMIDYPARKLPYLTPIRLMMVLAGLAAMAAIVLCAKDQGAVFLAQGAPEAITGLVTFDVGAYLEIAALVSMLAAVTRFRAAIRVATAPIVRMARSIIKGSIHALCHARRAIRMRLRRLLEGLKQTDEEERWVNHTLRQA